MAKPWEELKAELIRETAAIFMDCPDEIKLFHYGIMTHSEAGKYALNQFFGHQVHAYAGYMIYSSDGLDSILQLARRPTFGLEQLKEMFVQMSKPADREYTVSMMVKYGGQTNLGKYIDKTLAGLQSVDNKEEFVDLISAFQSYVTRLYWWFHWYFPWGIGPAVCPRRSVEDIREMMRLSGIDSGKQGA